MCYNVLLPLLNWNENGKKRSSWLPFNINRVIYITVYALDGIDIYIVVIYHQIITNIFDKGWRKNISYYSNISGNASYKPNFGPYSSASVRPNFSQKIFGGASVRLKR